ncbi:MAG TPA: hypothetical protein VJ044_09160, partial [Candidatus Hodarchaeales archaeon]|nr:hypothetical protein [Candidatus Hodarchaeales archaeon]
VDSIQIAENGRALHYSEVATLEYAPPEASRLHPANTFILESWDRFSLAVCFYEILFGLHPYAATSDGQYSNATTIEQKIQKGLFVHGSKNNYLSVIPPIHNNFRNLPVSIRDLFVRAFEDGHTNPNSRPSAEEWGMTIHQELQQNFRIKPNSVVLPSTRISTPPPVSPYDYTRLTHPKPPPSPSPTNRPIPAVKLPLVAKLALSVAGAGLVLYLMIPSFRTSPTPPVFTSSSPITSTNPTVRTPAPNSALKTGLILRQNTQVFAEPNTGSRELTALSNGDKVTIIRELVLNKDKDHAITTVSLTISTDDGQRLLPKDTRMIIIGQRDNDYLASISNGAEETISLIP